MADLKTLLGNRIRELRTSKGCTQEKLAELSGLHVSYLGGVERAERNTSVASIGKIAEGLGVDPMELFRFPPDENRVFLQKQVTKALKNHEPALVLRVLQLLDEAADR